MRPSRRRSGPAWRPGTGVAAGLVGVALTTGAVLGTFQVLQPDAPTDRATTLAPPSTAAEPELTAAAAAEVVLIRTATAGARLSVLEDTDPDDRALLLGETSSDLAAAVTAAADLRATGVGDPDDLDRTVDLLQRLRQVVQALRRCTLDQDRSSGRPDRGAGPGRESGCSIDSAEVALARSAGTAAADLLPLSSSDPGELARWVAEAQRQVLADAAAPAPGRGAEHDGATAGGRSRP